MENLQPNVVTYNAAEDTNLRRMTNSRLRASTVSPIEIYALIRLPQTVLYRLNPEILHQDDSPYSFGPHSCSHDLDHHLYRNLSVL